MRRAGRTAAERAVAYSSDVLIRAGLNARVASSRAAIVFRHWGGVGRLLRRVCSVIIIGSRMSLFLRWSRVCDSVIMIGMSRCVESFS